MAGKSKTGDGLLTVKKDKENASSPKELDNCVSSSSESLSPTDKKRVSKVTEIVFHHEAHPSERYVSQDGRMDADSDKEDIPENFDLMRESLIEKAVDRFLEEDADKISDGEEIPRLLSQDYEARKQKMLQTAFAWDESKTMTKPKRHFRIPAAAAAAVALLVITASLSVARVDAMPEPIRVLVMQMQSLFSSASVDDQILYGDNQTTDFPTEIKTVYEPTIVLDGYEESERIILEKMVQIYYVDRENGEYSFQQMTIDFQAGYDTEGTEYEKIEVRGNQGIFYVKNGQNRLQWQQNGYMFEVTGLQDLEVLKKLAASLKPVEEQE